MSTEEERREVDTEKLNEEREHRRVVRWAWVFWIAMILLYNAMTGD